MSLWKRLETLCLVVAIAVGAACGADETPSGSPPAEIVGAPTISSATPAAPSALPAAHQGRGALRCATCHDADDRAKSTWKDTAKALGHDVRAALAERTTCTCCHLGEVRGFGEALEQRCFGCHGEIHVTIPKMAGAHCLACHGDTTGHVDVRDAAWECQKCHAEQQGEKAAIVVHRSEHCASCHKPHTEPWVVPRNCRDCHGEAATHGDAMPAGENACSMCHEPHEAAGEADGRCASCHANDDPKTPKIPATALFTGHDACTNCHAPHGADAANAKACTSCHAEVHTMNVGAAGAKPHGECASCHTTHDVKSPVACTTCHGTLKADHPPAGDDAHPCVGCHEPHPKDEAAPFAASCESCHGDVVKTGPPHGKAACITCHAPHDGDTQTPACGTCHLPKKLATAASPHADCERCHTAHQPRAALPTCASCHAAESETAAKGHSDCAKCHDTHLANVPAAGACVTCHADRTQGPHHGPEAPCASCHRPHGPDGPATPPACTTCHEIAKLPSLHQKPEHQACTDCHTAHEDVRADRATCTRCHQDRIEHEPTAKRCDGCHTFVPTR